MDHSAAQSPSKGPLRVGALPDCEAYLTEPSTTPVSPGHGSSGLFPLPTYLSYNPTTRARPFQRTHSFSRPLIVIIFTSLLSQFIEFDACTHPPPPFTMQSHVDVFVHPRMRSHRSPQVAAFVLIQSHLHVFHASIHNPFSWPLRGREFSRGHTSTLCLFLSTYSYPESLRTPQHIQTPPSL